MFTNACKLFWNLTCNVGGGSRRQSGQVHGLGCAISDRHVLTAQHVYSQHGYEWLIVIYAEGVWRCRIVKEWRNHDIALIEKEKLIKEAPLDHPNAFPELYTSMPSWGQSLGYLAWLTTRKPQGKDHSVTYFGQGHVAFFELEGEEAPLFALAGGTVQKGFSGGPVFTSKGHLVGIIVRSFQFVADLNHPVPQIVSMPLVSPIAPLCKALEGHLRET